MVHGAFADGSSWSGVIKILEKNGYPVVAAANPMRSVKGDADYVASILSSIKSPVVLVGHSYGGSVISEAASAISASESLPRSAISPSRATVACCAAARCSSCSALLRSVMS